MQEQIFCFLVFALAGIAGGFLYDAVSLVRVPFRQPWVRYVADFVFCALFAAGALLFSVHMGFPTFRAYMFIACMLGFLLYYKSFHKIVAIFVEKMYNGYKGRTKRERHICRKGSRCRRKSQRGSP